ncbi:hypothetical protein KC851_02620 [Candidatus Kaiserbacteria bacterium]|nr:hypothetical protein [Candidatus Kaiserbacteria bacterium]
MKKFLLTTVMTAIAAGFYHASTLIDTDVTAENTKDNLTEVGISIKNGVSDTVLEVSDKARQEAEESVVMVVEESDVTLGLEPDSLTGSVVSNLLFNQDDKKYDLSAKDSTVNTEFNLTNDAESVDEVETKYKKEIIEIYKEAPHLLDPEELEKYLEEYGYTSDDFIEQICRVLDGSE